MSSWKSSLRSFTRRPNRSVLSAIILGGSSPSPLDGFRLVLRCVSGLAAKCGRDGALARRWRIAGEVGKTCNIHSSGRRQEVKRSHEALDPATELAAAGPSCRKALGIWHDSKPPPTSSGGATRRPQRHRSGVDRLQLLDSSSASSNPSCIDTWSLSMSRASWSAWSLPMYRGRHVIDHTSTLGAERHQREPPSSSPSGQPTWASATVQEVVAPCRWVVVGIRQPPRPPLHRECCSVLEIPP